MLHSLKKNVSLMQGAASGGVPLPPEVLLLKQKLGSVKRQVTETTAIVDKANVSIKVQVAEQMVFARMFARAFPNGPDAPPATDTDVAVLDLNSPSEAQARAAAFAKQAENVYNTHCRAGSPNEKWTMYKLMNTKLKAYCAAITKLEATYPRLTAAKSEATRYNAKFDSLLHKGKADDLKIARNLQKSDQFREGYQTLLKEVLAQQCAMYAKAPDALRMALVMYWGTRERQMALLNMTFDETAGWAQEHTNELLQLDVAAMNFPVAEYDDATANSCVAAKLESDESDVDAVEPLSKPSVSSATSHGAAAIAKPSFAAVF